MTPDLTPISTYIESLLAFRYSHFANAYNRVKCMEIECGNVYEFAPMILEREGSTLNIIDCPE